MSYLTMNATRLVRGSFALFSVLLLNIACARPQAAGLAEETLTLSTTSLLESLEKVTPAELATVDAGWRHLTVDRYYQSALAAADDTRFSVDAFAFSGLHSKLGAQKDLWSSLQSGYSDMASLSDTTVTSISKADLEAVLQHLQTLFGSPAKGGNSTEPKQLELVSTLDQIDKQGALQDSEYFLQRAFNTPALNNQLTRAQDNLRAALAGATAMTKIAPGGLPARDLSNDIRRIQNSTDPAYRFLNPKSTASD